jgi:hypothetical protein
VESVWWEEEDDLTADELRLTQMEERDEGGFLVFLS